ncbi:RNA polymerase 2 transcription factor siii subunit [Grosmannia clavigera kw1407]|uniref:RNA polymerase 2 transcription factor siii subunit n=1 Tax=Grosmannia clavigera (strain kw1407 / UAMH 11150) TaxID=655863 RepID=F0XRI9_GROCL|nr:RNA polymerase 2 transcription factor siii subunit [Grosmannia clavigera kw1407]EFX00012.1 RNA polymerase 2 transcription factor siii subunit [Grosmannia clavigera kw1407]
MASLQQTSKQVGPRSLQRMCLAVALRNVASITDIGELPFEAARPLLKKVENAAQLHELELNCPQLAAEPGQMAELWSRLLQKKFPKWDERGYAFDDDMSWFEIYNAVKEAVDRDNAAATAHLQQQLAGFSRDKASKTMQFVNNRQLLSQLPGARRRGPGSGPSFSFGGGSRTRMTTGQSVLRRARREAKEISKVSALSTPTSALRAAQGQIRRAPEAMVHDYRIAHNPAVMIRAPRRHSSATAAAPVTAEHSEAEARLVALKSGPPAVPKSIPAKPRPLKRPTTHDDLFDSYEDLDDEDLFGDAPTKKVRLSVADLEQPSRLPQRPKTSVSTRPGRPDAPSAVPPRARPPVPAPAPVTDAARKPVLRGSPGPPARKKAAVDIFFRPKKR